MKLLPVGALACALALIAPATPAFAQNGEVIFTEYKNQYAYFYYPETCTLDWKGGEGSQSTPDWSDDQPGEISVSCPWTSNFKTFNVQYTSGGPDGGVVDNISMKDVPANGIVKKAAIRRAPYSADRTIGIPFKKYWTNFVVTPAS